MLSVIYGYWVLGTLPVANDDLKKIESGMTKESVKDILGTPTNTDSDPIREEWEYSKAPIWTIVRITFNSEGKVE